MKRIYTQMGRTGLQQYSGYISEEWYPPLVGAAGAKIYRMMADNSAIIYATLRAIDMILARVPYKIVEASPSQKDIEAKEFIDSCFQDMNPGWPETKSEILSMLVYGWSYFERLYRKRQGMHQSDPLMRSKFNDGLIGWKSWEIRSQESLLSWVFDEEDGKLLGMTQMPAPDFIPRFVPLEKSLLFRPTITKGNPEGQSSLRGSYRAWYMLTNMEDIEAIGAERDLAGYPVLYAPEAVVNPKDSSTKGLAAKRKAQDIITGMKRDEREGVLLPSTTSDGHREWELQLLSTGGTRQFPTNAIIGRYERNVAMTLLANFILLGAQKTGSYALASTLDELFRDSLQTLLDRIAGVINSDAIPDLIAINPFDEDVGIPRIEFGKVGSVSIKEIGDFIGKLSGAKDLFADDIDLENHLRRLADLPPRAMPKPQQLQPESGSGPDQANEPDEDNDPGVQSQEEALGTQIGGARDQGAPVQKHFSRRARGRQVA